MRHRIFVTAAIVYLIVANIAWIVMDTRPPFWDMAVHENSALRVYRDFEANGIGAFKTVPQDSGSYPPLYYLVVALFYWLFGTSVDAAQLANMPAIILLAFSTYGIAKSLLPAETAAIAAVLVNFFPFLLWLSRETLIDYWLTAVVAAAAWALIQTREFTNKRFSLFFGVLCGLGMLTKWTFVLYLGLPALWAARRNWRNALSAAAVAAAISAYWYVPQAGTMPAFWRQVAAAGRYEGDPPVLSLQAIIFYVRALEGVQLFFPLFAVFLVGLFLVARDRNVAWTPVVLWLLGGWLGLMLIGDKDPRYSAPLLPGVAVISAVPFRKRKYGVVLLFGFLAFQHYLVSFGIPQLPTTVVLMKGIRGPLSWNWSLYSQQYFGLWGKPAAEDWQIEEVLKTVSATANVRVRLGLIPDLPRFDAAAFNLYIDLYRYPIVLNRLLQLDESVVTANDYILVSITNQGSIASFAPNAARINEYVFKHPERFQIVSTFVLPNGETIRLYKLNPPAPGKSE